MGSREQDAAYWMRRAERETLLAQRSPSGSEAAQHKMLAARFVDIAHHYKRVPLERSSAG